MSGPAGRVRLTGLALLACLAMLVALPAREHLAGAQAPGTPVRYTIVAEGSEVRYRVLPIPRVARVLSVEDTIRLEADLVLRKGS